MWRLRMSLANSSPGASGVTARPNTMGPSERAGGADERRGEKPCGIRELSECGSFRLQKAVPRSKENAAVERREARRSALWIGNPVSQTGWAKPQGWPTVAAFRGCEFRRSATLCWRGEGFETDNLDGSPPGCAARQRSRTGQTNLQRKDDVEIGEPNIGKNK